MTEIIIEVGMHNGKHTRGLLEEYNGTFYGFEPVPELQPILNEKYGNNNRVNIFPYAVSDKDLDSVSFNISKLDGIHDYGCSSLHEFNKNIYELWPGRKDFAKGKTVKVKCVRLDNFLSDLEDKPSKINYFWCDAQGNDWKVLKGLGDYINIIEKGKVEAALNVSLYNTDNHKNDIKYWLEERGFTTFIKPDRVSKECDIYFEREK